MFHLNDRICLWWLWFQGFQGWAVWARFWSFATLLLTQFNTKIEKECWSNVFRLLSGKQKMSRANPSIWRQFPYFLLFSNTSSWMCVAIPHHKNWVSNWHFRSISEWPEVTKVLKSRTFRMMVEIWASLGRGARAFFMWNSEDRDADAKNF